MPISYEIADGGRFVHTKAIGAVSDEDLLTYQAALLADPRVQPGAYELFDATMAHGAGLSDAVIERIVNMDKANAKRLAGGKCAVVVRSEFDFADRLERLHEGPHEVMVFFNLDVARAWLGKKTADVE